MGRWSPAWWLAGAFSTWAGLLGLGAAPAVAWAGEAEAKAVATAPVGRLGLRYVGVPEGLLVTAVEPGLGAAAAGVQVGMIVQAVDGVELPPGGSQRAAALRGPEDSSVELRVVGPLDAKARSLTVQRTGAAASKAALAAEHAAAGPPTPSARPGAQPAEVRAFRAAMRARRPSTARRATESLVAAGYAGLSPASAVGAGLTVARRRPEVMQAAALALLEAAPADPTLLLRVADALAEVGDHEAVLQALKLRSAALPPELRLADGQPAVTGSSSLRAKGLEVESLLALGQREAASERLREMLPYSESAGLVAALGMAPPERGEPWRGRAAPVAPFSMPLASGGEWSFAAHDGQVRVLAFWATWCGPCAEELPALSQRVAMMRNAGLSVVAVSVDQGLSPAAIQESAVGMGVELPVALAPRGLTEAMGVSGIPAVRVIGRDGVLRYAAHGYSEGSVAGIEAAITAALNDRSAGEVVFAKPWGPGQATLRYFLAAPGVTGVTVADGRLVVGRPGHGVTMYSPTGELITEPEEGLAAPLENLVWLGGPVGTSGSAPMLRALDADGAARWARGLPGAPVALATHGDELWVATKGEVVVLDAAGAVLARRALAVRSIADNAPGEGVFAVVGDERRELVRVGEQVTDRVALELPGAALVASGGEVADQGTASLVSGRFGPDGARRVVLTRRDGGLLALDGAGSPALAAALAGPTAVAVGDLDGDGHDELVLRVEDRGVLVLDLRLP